MLSKNVRKKIVGKKYEKRFLYSHEYRDEKMGEQNARNNFYIDTLIVRAKNVVEKNRRKKVRKTFVYIHTNIVTKKWGGKTRETIFQKHKNSAFKKCWEKKS